MPGAHFKTHCTLTRHQLHVAMYSYLCVMASKTRTRTSIRCWRCHQPGQTRHKRSRPVAAAPPLPSSPAGPPPHSRHSGKTWLCSGAGPPHKQTPAAGASRTQQRLKRCGRISQQTTRLPQSHTDSPHAIACLLIGTEQCHDMPSQAAQFEQSRMEATACKTCPAEMHRLNLAWRHVAGEAAC